MECGVPACIETRMAVHNDLPPKSSSILIVEDQCELRQLLARVFESAGYSVTSAKSPADALAMLNEGRRFDLLVTDITMPEMNGSILAKRARELDPDLKLLFISGSVDVADIAKQHPGAIFLEKPFRPADLLRRIEQALAA